MLKFIRERELSHQESTRLSSIRESWKQKSERLLILWNKTLVIQQKLLEKRKELITLRYLQRKNCFK